MSFKYARDRSCFTVWMAWMGAVFLCGCVCLCHKAAGVNNGLGLTPQSAQLALRAHVRACV